MIDAAAGELLAFAADWMRRHSLTPAEYCWMLGNLLANRLRMDAGAERERLDAEARERDHVR